MRGRKPKPTGLKIVSGNPGKRPLNSREPRAEPDLPTCPSHLLPTAKAEWKRLARELYHLGVLTRLDRATLAGYCQAYGRWVEAEKKLTETPGILKMPSGYIQANPWLTIATKQMELMQRFAIELGLTPSSRSRVETVRRPPARFGAVTRPADAYLNPYAPIGRSSTASKPWESDHAAPDSTREADMEDRYFK